MKYLSKKDHKTEAEFVSQDDKTKVIRIRILNGERKGKCIDVSPTTLQRWWKQISNEEEVSTEETHTEKTKPEVFDVTVVDEETGKKREVSIGTNDFIAGVDDSAKTYDFNNQPKAYREMPEVVREIYMLDKDPYPAVEEVVDMLVSWGANVKAYAEWIKLTNNVRLIFRRNMRCPDKSCIEVRMREEYTVDGYTTEYLPNGAALIKNEPYTIKVKKLKDLEVVVKSLLTTI